MKRKKKNIFMPKDHMDALYNSANPLVKVKIIKTIIEDLLGLLRIKMQCFFHKY